MDNDFSPAFWAALERLISESNLVIDRPRNSTHPRYPQVIYPLDYGYLENTASMDGSGIDVWRGSHPQPILTGIVVTVDLMKRDSEIKLLLGCTADEVASILAFHNNSAYMKGIFISR